MAVKGERSGLDRTQNNTGSSGRSGSSGGASTGALTQGYGSSQKKSYTKARDPSGAGPGPTQAGTVGDHSVEGGSVTRAERGDKPGGGTTTSYTQTPGAVPNYPEADALTVIEKIFAPLIPGSGPTLGLATIGNAYDEESGTFDFTKTVFGGEPGPQQGYQPDRYKGQANLTGVGDPGSASGTNPREIAGRSYGARAQTPAVDQTDGAGAGTGSTALYSDVVLKDRRKPYPSLQQMLETML